MGLLKIHNQAFVENRLVKSITIPVTLKKIGEYAFSGCEKLEEVIFEAGSNLMVPRWYQYYFVPNSREC